MSMADGEAPPVAALPNGHAYSISPLTPGPYPLPDLGTGNATATSMTAPLHCHPSDTMSSLRGINTLPYTHTQRPSASSVPASWRNSGHQHQNLLSVSSAAGVVSHASEQCELPAPASLSAVPASMPPARASMSPTSAERPIPPKLARAAIGDGACAAYA
ncbi:hypothetical protein B0H19DRAFT_1366638 [Mycena capillaripes]|nr:hypothetical protein B0H19DRAFT_1366638 [Mycena capillaripes]